jgi:hypothetical protein
MTMKRTLVAGLTALAAATTMMAGVVHVIPATRHADIEGSASEMLIKRIPEGQEFLLAVNKGENLNYIQIQWFKDGVKLEGETSQELRRSVATQDLNGVYTVSLTSPCGSATSKPMQVIIGPNVHMINTNITPRQEGVAGGTVNETTTSVYELKQCVPNPVTDKATINFTTRESAEVMLKVVDLNGNVIATLVNEVLPAGDHEVMFNTRSYTLSNGLYYYVLSAPGFTDTKPLMITR